MKLQIKNEYLGKILSNSKVGQFNVDSITEDAYQFFYKMGFAFIFEEVCERCLGLECKCKSEETVEIKDFKPKARGKKDESNS